ncbi:LAFA_0D03928g1_1 [Lachancea sp. 'fantastica']|nr:LAFA_0D03928g1_1 [Lachancea sp. 'fantastica']
MVSGKTVFVPEDAAKFESFKPAIEAYNKDVIEQMEKFDPEFYAKCVAEIPAEEVLDSEPIDATSFLSLLSPQERTIVGDLTIEDLTQKQLSGELTAVEITRAFIKASIVAQLTTNCVMQFMIPEALQRAQELDDYLQTNKKLVGPFHGVVVSLKEHINVKDRITCASYVSYLDNIAPEDAASVKILYKMGAVFHARTAQPQGIMHLDTWNNINGRTRNPRSTRMSPGGSSGGESAIVAMNGSVIGVGSDIGGSIRAPAAFTDIFGIRPTTRRISLYSGVSSGKGQESIVAVQGPLARSIEELDTYMRVYINEGKPWLYDPTCVPVEWREPKLPKKIRIGVLYDDNLVTPFPAITRGIKTAVNKLSENAEFEFVHLNPTWFSEKEMEDIYTTNLKLYTCDGNQVQMEMWSPSGEPLLPLTKHYMKFGGGEALSCYDNKMLNAQRDALKMKMFQKYFADVDFILSPTYNGPAEMAAESLYWGYTSFWNLLDYPNVVFPVNVAHDVEKDAQIPELKQNKYEKMVWYKDNGEIRYDPKSYIGGPVALQLTGNRFCDEDVVALTKKFVAALGVERR